MYGLINRAIEEMVTGANGHGCWHRICARAGVSAEGFVALRAYDDGVTHALVQSTSSEFELPPAQVLETFGEHWILYTADVGYAELLRSTGASFREFVVQLDNLHGRIETIFPEMRPPIFRLEDVAPGECRVYYSSQREGMAPMVIGLMRGLGRRFGEELEIEHVHAKRSLDEEDVFVVRGLSS